MLNQLKFFPQKKIDKAHNLGDKILSLPISEEHNEKQILQRRQQFKEFYFLCGAL